MALSLRGRGLQQLQPARLQLPAIGAALRSSRKNSFSVIGATVVLDVGSTAHRSRAAEPPSTCADRFISASASADRVSTLTWFIWLPRLWTFDIGNACGRYRPAPNSNKRWVGSMRSMVPRPARMTSAATFSLPVFQGRRYGPSAACRGRGRPGMSGHLHQLCCGPPQIKASGGGSSALRALGYDVWRDDQLPAHRAYAEVIEERRQCGRKAVVVIWLGRGGEAAQWVFS